MGARSKQNGPRIWIWSHNSRVPRWGHDQNVVADRVTVPPPIAECPDGGTIKTRTRVAVDASMK